MLKAIATLVYEGTFYNVGQKYSAKDLKDVPQEYIDQCFVEVNEAEEVKTVDTNSDEVDFTKLKVAELTQIATDKGLEVPDGAKKADLIALIQG